MNTIQTQSGRTTRIAPVRSANHLYKKSRKRNTLPSQLASTASHQSERYYISFMGNEFNTAKSESVSDGFANSY